jgi:hypothetical protein
MLIERIGPPRVAAAREILLSDPGTLVLEANEALYVELAGGHSRTPSPSALARG